MTQGRERESLQGCSEVRRRNERQVRANLGRRARFARFRAALRGAFARAEEGHAPARKRLDGTILAAYLDGFGHF